jgi:uncharacterized membrane protein SirB2
MPALKLIHVSAVVISGIFFFTRGIWMLLDSRQLQARWVKILPHVIDTILLASALALAWQIQQYPFVHGWLTVKVVGLLIYIVLGSIALKRGKTKTVRVIAWLASLLVFGYIVWVAVTHNPIPFLNA